MIIKVEKLRKNLSLLQPVVPRKPTLPLLTHVCIEHGQMTGSDLETTVSIDLPEAREAAFLLPLKTVLEILKYVPGDELLTLETQPKPNSQSRLLKLFWKDGSAAYEVKDVLEYPGITFKASQAEGDLNGDWLIEALVAALPYCATEETRPVLTGVTLYLNSVLQVAAADGFRLSYQSLNQSYPVEEKIVIPAGAVRALEHLWQKEPAQVSLTDNLISQITQARQFRLSLGDYTEVREGSKPVPQAMRLQFGNITLTSKLIAGTPPDHLRLLNDFREPVKVKLMAPELYQAVRRVKAIAADGTGIVRLQWTDSQMTVSARSEESGEAQATIPVVAGSIPDRIALNVAYLLDYLAGKEGLITLGKAEGSSPMLFHYGSKPIVAIMPMQVKWDDEPPAATEPEAAAAEAQTEAAEDNPEPKGEEEENPEAVEEEEIYPESSSEPVAAGVAAEPEKPAESGKSKEAPKRRGRRKKA